MNNASLFTMVALLFVGAVFGILAFHNWMNQRKTIACGAFIAAVLCNWAMMLVLYNHMSHLPWLLLFITFVAGWSAGIATLKLFERPSL